MGKIISLDFLKSSVNHFISHDCLKTAAALSFTTILSIVPIIALLFLSLSTFYSDSENQTAIHNAILNLFSPSFGKELQATLFLLADQASKLQTFGLLALITTVLLSLNTIDESINYIWGVKRCKRTIVKLILYFLTLMMIPIMVAISFSVTTYFFSITIFQNTLVDDGLNFVTINVIPIIASWLAFTSIYKWIPNTVVSTKYALMGGAVAAILFELAKVIFLMYIRYFPSYDLIYGAFAVLPLFCIWIYISWVIVLVGAVITYNLTTLIRTDALR